MHGGDDNSTASFNQQGSKMETDLVFKHGSAFLKAPALVATVGPIEHLTKKIDKCMILILNHFVTNLTFT